MVVWVQLVYIANVQYRYQYLSMMGYWGYVNIGRLDEWVRWVLYIIQIIFQKMFEDNLRKLLIKIGQIEQKLQNYRQLLNEQIQFNIKDLYMLISQNCSQVTAYQLHIFIADQADQDNADIQLYVLESVIKGYNCCTSMNLSFTQFAIIFISKQNRLLAKLTIQRNSLGQIPNYLLAYAKKIILLEVQMHKNFIQFKKMHSSSAEQWIRDNCLINQQNGIQQFDQSAIVKICSQIQIQPENVLRYFKKNQKQGIMKQKMQALFTLKNNDKLSQFLRSKSPKSLKCGRPDPFIRPQFHQCLSRPKQLQNFSFRQLKSIQKHLDRLNSKSKTQLYQKISCYRSFMEKQLVIACQAINDIIQLEKEIQSERIQLRLCTDFYPVLFYGQLEKDRGVFLIPSALRDCLAQLGLKVQLNHLYGIFKRFSTRSDGKLTFNEFCQIFDLCSTQYNQIQRNRMIKTLQDVQLNTIKTFLKLMKILIKNEQKVQKIKAKLQSQVNIRQIFVFFDGDQDGFVSMLDFRVVWKKYLYMNIQQNDIKMFWHRMKLSKDPNNMIQYDRFMVEMTPRSQSISNRKNATMRSNK